VKEAHIREIKAKKACYAQVNFCSNASFFWAENLVEQLSTDLEPGFAGRIYCHFTNEKHQSR